MNELIEQEITGIVSALMEDYDNDRYIDEVNLFQQPDKREIISIINGLMTLVYPGYYLDRTRKLYTVQSNLSVVAEDVMYRLNKQIGLALRFKEESLSQKDIDRSAQEMALAFFRKIPGIRAILETDLDAAFEGDPAAKHREEIILSSPGLLAITVHRLAHELFLLRVPLIPRIMTEHVHSLTGIDIHPGATIGKYFFIDHGTGIVIGETAQIGNHVKLYQGVTLGALTTRGGQALREVKRHPTIQDHVTIYAGASILGGATVIGTGSVIGGNAFITSSIPGGTRVSIKNQELFYKKGQGQEEVAEELDQGEEWYYVI
jgi:serine O-acetyltransferase